MSISAIAISLSTRVIRQHDTSVALPTINTPQDIENQYLVLKKKKLTHIDERTLRYHSSSEAVNTR
jgi:hypothetical protein